MAIVPNRAFAAGDSIELAIRAWIPTEEIVEREWDLKHAYAHFELPLTGNYSSTDLERHVLEHLAQILQIAGGPTGFRQLRQLGEQFLLRALVDGEPLEPYYSLVDVFKRLPRDRTYAPFDDAGRWQAAVNLVVDYFQHTGAFHPQRIDEAARLMVRQRALAWAVSHLRAAGYAVQVIQGEPILSLAEATRVVNRLENLINAIGPMRVLVTLFQGIQHHFDHEIGRYLLVRRYEPGFADREPGVPVGYLLQLAVKHLRSANLGLVAQAADWEELIGLAQAFGAIYNVEPYHNAEVFVDKGEGLIGELDEIATYDSLFTFPQFRPNDMACLLQGLFRWVTPQQEGQLGVSVDDFIEVALGILAFPEEGHRICFTADQLKAKLRAVPSNVVDTVLDILTHPVATANAGFTLPHEQGAVSFSNRPLLMTEEGLYLLVKRSWCAPAFYEALASHARATIGGTVESMIGTAFEVLVRDVLAQRNVLSRHGQYRVNGEDGECDAVIETDDTWIFIETKKKALTRASRGANTVALVTDLAKSLIDMQNQLAQHEVLLRQTGGLPMQNGQQTVQFGGKAIERIALSLFDYGGFQDRIVLKHIQEGLAGRALVARDSAQHPTLDALTPKLARMGQRYAQLRDMGAVVGNNPFFHCWFISLGQLLVMLDHVQDAANFKTEVFRSRHLTFASLNLYFEYKHARQFAGQAR